MTSDALRDANLRVELQHANLWVVLLAIPVTFGLCALGRTSDHLSGGNRLVLCYLTSLLRFIVRHCFLALLFSVSPLEFYRCFMLARDGSITVAPL